MAIKKTSKKKSDGMNASDVRSLVHEIINFQGDTVDQVLANCITDKNYSLERSQALNISEVLKSAMRDAAFNILASKKFD